MNIIDTHAYAYENTNKNRISYIYIILLYIAYILYYTVLDYIILNQIVNTNNES